ncbi:unnamed protein product [Cuscuta campestris]|uniref:MI domain-containing protein n=1 Tax=Cuscuta campestris TaxID=132261 RepID=A0A484KNB0_9ASTE|nr:unnamed protein product [Cuscuta campestris]
MVISHISEHLRAGYENKKIESATISEKEDEAFDLAFKIIDIMKQEGINVCGGLISNIIILLVAKGKDQEAFDFIKDINEEDIVHKVRLRNEALSFLMESLCKRQTCDATKLKEFMESNGYKVI